MMINEFNPAQPGHIINEIFNTNDQVGSEFSKHFPKELLEFADNFSLSYKKYLEFDRLLQNTKNEQKGMVLGLTYLFLDNIFTSVKLFILGYQIPAGNLMRQVTEGVALASLCSLKDPIVINTRKEKGKLKKIHFYTNFLKDSSDARSHLSVKYLELNAKQYGISSDAIVALNNQKKIFNNYSHPSILAISSLVSHEYPGKIFMGGGFDKEKIDQYRIELVNRVRFCAILPNVIQWLIENIKELPE